MERSVKFYKEVLGLRVTMDLGANVTLTGGVALQTQESWCEFISKDLQSISFGGNAAELYFEEDKFDDFLKKLAAIKGIFYVHPVQQYSWGQRVIRFYDPDFHILEVGENMKSVCRRFLDSDMTIEAAAIRMNVSENLCVPVLDKAGRWIDDVKNRNADGGNSWCVKTFTIGAGRLS